ncbi:MAG: hypothetical protein LBH70_03650 [Spirochaetaceae bacterium]|nr:hypothetical protein [Spirochaetaceae bacterium]
MKVLAPQLSAPFVVCDVGEAGVPPSRFTVPGLFIFPLSENWFILLLYSISPKHGSIIRVRLPYNPRFLPP